MPRRVAHLQVCPYTCALAESARPAPGYALLHPYPPLAPCAIVPRIPAIALILLGLLAALPARADPPPPALEASRPLQTQPLVHLEWRGQVRARGEVLGGVRNNADNAELPTHLDVRHGNADPNAATLADRVQGTDLRLRLEPSLHVGDWSQLNTQLDAWGMAGGRATLASFADRYGQADWSTGSLQSGLAMRRMWLHSKVFGLVDLDVGRMPDHFGMGVVRNSGDDLLGDWQTSIDSVKLGMELLGFRFSIARSNLFTWPSGQGANAATLYNSYAGGSSNGAWLMSSGQSGLPFQDSADVIRYDLGVAGGKLHGEPGLEWALALLWLSQDQAFSVESLQNPGTTTPAPAKGLANPACGNECILLTQRTLRTYTFQAYTTWRGTWRSAPLVLQAEGDAIYGTIGRSDITADPDAKTIVSGGAAGRATWQPGELDLKLDLGAASGESNGGFGVNDTNNFKLGGTPDGADRTAMHGFRFNRAFRIDGLLFRDVIGAVANAGYLRPALAWHPWGRGTGDLALEAAVLGAVALSPDATPGKHAWIGLEPELSAHLHLDHGLELFGRGTLLMPGAALANTAGVAAEPAWRADAVARWRF